MCLCETVRELARDFDEDNARQLASALNEHLTAIRTILSKSKSLSRRLQYCITLNNTRTSKVQTISSVDTSKVNQLHSRFKDDISGFWDFADGSVNADLRRRVATVAVFLRSSINPDAEYPPTLARFIQGQKVTELRYAGKKYIKIARKLQSLGSIIWLPLDIPASTYERYVTMDDESLMGHLADVCSNVPDLSHFTRRLVLSQLNDTLLNSSYHNLFTDYIEFIPGTEILHLLLQAFGGLHVPAIIFTSVRHPQRRWGENGELYPTTAEEYGLPPHLIEILSDNRLLGEALAHPDITPTVLESGTCCWSVKPMSPNTTALSPQTLESITAMALKLVCFSTPPCFDGDTSWSTEVRGLVFSLLDKVIDKGRMPQPLKIEAIQALLYLAERDSLAIRAQAIRRARGLMRKTLPWHIQASIVLFQSIHCRLDGHLDKADNLARVFLEQHADHPVTARRDKALEGRLHICRIDNMLQRADDDVAARLFEWSCEFPMSPMELEVSRRLQGAVARFFQSVGDFDKCRESLEDFLRLDPAEPLMISTRRLVIARLADTYCELQDHEKSLHLLEEELPLIHERDRGSRPARRVYLALAEASIGLGRLDVAELVLEDAAKLEPQHHEDFTEEMLYLRRVLAVCRVRHERGDYAAAVEMWSAVLQTLERYANFRSSHGYVVGIVHLSVAHALLQLGDDEGCKKAWSAAAEVFGRERCKYQIPTIATTWLLKVVGEVHAVTRWPFTVRRPGGQPDIVWA